MDDFGVRAILRPTAFEWVVCGSIIFGVFGGIILAFAV